MEKLGLNLPLLLFQLINFGILVAVLSSLLYTRIRDMLQERTERIEQSLKDSDQVKQQLANAKRDYDTEVAKARQEAQSIINQARERAKVQEAEIIAQARQDADALRADARDQAQRERDQMIREVRVQLAQVVKEAASQVLQAELQAKGHDELIDRTLAQLERRN